MSSRSVTLEQPNPPLKVLVVGSAGHAHVTCSTWTDLTSLNLKDFDVIVFNVASLDDNTIARLPRHGFFDKVRRELSLLLASGGKIIALTPERRVIKQKSDDPRTNWEWSPFDIGIALEAGDTIETKVTMFERYLSRLKRWSFYFFVPQGALTGELIDVFGSPHQNKYMLQLNAYAINRYGKMLAGDVLLAISFAGHNNICGGVTVLPAIPELEQKEAVRLILEDLIGKPQQSLPPDWVDQIPMPFVAAINADIAQKNAEIKLLSDEIAANEQKRADIEKWKKLVYATGRELEQIFEEAIVKLGAQTTPANAEEEFVFEYMGKFGVVECKGVGKSVSLEHVRQADSHVLKFLETDKPDGKGVLLGNAWRNLPPSERGAADTPVFPTNVVKHAVQREIALVGAADFLCAFCEFLEGKMSGEAILDAMLTQSGIVDFRRTS
ncbi:hypothetical protein GCM10011611_11200 [Aliidongia dinghuensis]|uniref:Restriction endonuclease n=1 Tax=Aliidongia dinghuensis TaxID=1867774 RepID=A0A8J2YQM5_9PROT|nr:hypothetical protein [Aliidongia dinghuensis]GGF07506.1 hypothetical protein GCM10011611_11200 [Aliidongia dinghuensis]